MSEDESSEINEGQSIIKSSDCGKLQLLGIKIIKIDSKLHF